MIKLHDIFHIDPKPSLVDMSKSDKHRLMDSVLNAQDSNKRGLLIDFGLSHSARRINNRIYTPRGQRAGINTWTNPYEKPIIRNHNSDTENIIGRIASVDWVPTDNQAIGFFKTAQDFMLFKEIVDADEPRKIYKALSDRNLLLNKKWPGLGKLAAQARISDESAIEKFLDGRYLTFSAGTHTDRYVCGICGEDWARGDICEHRPGAVHDDGLVGVFVTGIFAGDEASVVTKPADDLGLVEAMEFTDSKHYDKVPAKSLLTDSHTIYITDGLLNTGEAMTTKNTASKESTVEEPQQKDARKFAVELFDTETTDEQLDSITGENHYETNWLVQVHDALHHEYDWRLRYPEDKSDERIPRAVFAMHGKIHGTSETDGFRDSLLNGPLDGFDSAGEASDEYIIKSASSEDSEEDETLTDENTSEPEVKDEQQEESNTDEQETSTEENNTDGEETKTEDQKQEQEEEQETEVLEDEQQDNVTEDTELEDESEEDIVDDVDIDWYLLDAALLMELGDAQLSTEARKKLKKSQFCGPDRSFPVPDCAHVTAAKRLVGRAKLSADQKKKVIACVNRKAKGLGCETSDDQTDSDCKQNWLNALKVIDELKAELETLKKTQQELDNENASVQNEDSIKQETNDNQEPQSKLVENPSANGTETRVKFDDSLGAFEKKVINNYVQIRDNTSLAAAQAYLRRQSRYISKTFNINNYIEEID